MSRRHAPLKFALSLLLASPFSAFAADPAKPPPAEAAIPSRLVPDESGVLRLHAGTDGKSALKLAEALSADIDSGYLVVVVMTNDQYEAQAIAHGRKLQAWFEKQDSTRDYVPLVVHKIDQGVGFVYYLYAYPYIHDELAPRGIMTVQESVDLLKDAKVVHMARGHLWHVENLRLDPDWKTKGTQP